MVTAAVVEANVRPPLVKLSRPLAEVALKPVSPGASSGVTFTVTWRVSETLTRALTVTGVVTPFLTNCFAAGKLVSLTLTPEVAVNNFLLSLLVIKLSAVISLNSLESSL